MMKRMRIALLVSGWMALLALAVVMTLDAGGVFDREAPAAEVADSVAEAGVPAASDPAERAGIEDPAGNASGAGVPAPSVPTPPAGQAEPAESAAPGAVAAHGPTAGTPASSVLPATAAARQPQASAGKGEVRAAGALDGAAASATERLRFAVLGDSRGASDAISEGTLRKLLARLGRENTQPAFLLFTGDMIKGGAVEIELAQWKDIVDDYYPIQSVYPAIGNHEWNEQAFGRQFPHLPEEQLPGYGRTVYRFDYGPARFITLNTIRKDGEKRYVVAKDQRDWLDRQLAEADKPYVFVQMHIPAYPGSTHYGKSLDANPAERDALWAVLDRHPVTAVLVGHEHNYSRRIVDASFSGSGYSFTRALAQLTIGSAGAPLYTSVKDTRGVAVGPKPSYHYLLVDLAPEKATFTVKDVEGNVLDRFALSPAKRGGGP